MRVIQKESKGGSCRGVGGCAAGEVVEEGDIEEGNENGDRRRERKNSRGEVHGGDGTEETVQHQDAKRVLLAMKAHEGRGGDGTIVYYIVQEGEVKPRQN
jgi:tRNA-splicing endonuclease subunit Sen15, fungi type